jgi:hypothetical protein
VWLRHPASEGNPHLGSEWDGSFPRVAGMRSTMGA